MPIAYAQVSPKIWDDRIRRCSPTAGHVRAYIATCPGKTSEGFFHLPVGYIATDTGLSTEAVISALSELRNAGIVDWDADREIVLDFQALEVLGLNSAADNRIKGALNQLRCLGPTPLWERFLSHAQSASYHLYEAIVRANIASPPDHRRGRADSGSN